jgi:small neutral amino acid transporter SnatA (MarC family)
MIAGIWFAFAYFGILQAVIFLIIAQALSYVPLMVGLSRLLPEVTRTELRWYAAFLVLLGLAVVMPWPAA